MSEKLQVMQMCISCRDMLALLTLQLIHIMRAKHYAEGGIRCACPQLQQSVVSSLSH